MRTNSTVSVELAGIYGGETMGKTQQLTIEEKKRWLRRVSWAWRDLQELYQEKEENFHRATAKTASYSAAVVAGSKNPHKYDAMTLSQIEARISRKEKQLDKLRRETLVAINSLASKELRDIFKEIYVNCRTIPETAVRVGFSERHVQRLHRKGLEAIHITRSMAEKNTKRPADLLAQ